MHLSVADLSSRERLSTDQKLVNRKKRISISKSKQECTIFISKISNEASARVIWTILKTRCTINDIILPKKWEKEIIGMGSLKLRQNQKQGGSFPILNSLKDWDEF